MNDIAIGDIFIHAEVTERKIVAISAYEKEYFSVRLHFEVFVCNGELCEQSMIQVKR